jgi:hypothetical protein
MEAYKRALVEGWCETIAAAPYVPTINANTKPELGETLWFTVAWEPDAVEAIAYCGVTQETGQLVVVVAGEPNQGDQAVATAADAIVTALLERTDLSGQLTLERAGATIENSAGAADRWYSLRTPIDYRLISAREPA